MKKVYICSPCRGDYENNIQRAKDVLCSIIHCFLKTLMSYITIIISFKLR